jgi:adenylate cyclase
MSFFAELKRRNVFRVAAAYAVVAWLLIEVSDTIFPRLGLPEWTVTFVIALLLLGFPWRCFSPGLMN